MNSKFRDHYEINTKFLNNIIHSDLILKEDIFLYNKPIMDCHCISLDILLTLTEASRPHSPRHYVQWVMRSTGTQSQFNTGISRHMRAMYTYSKTAICTQVS